MTPQLQLSTAQLAHAEQVYKRKVDAKTLECASLGQMRDVSADVVAKFFNFRDELSQKPARDAVYNYLTAKLNQAIIELEELKLQLTGIQAMSNRIQPAVIVGSHSQNSK
jgi:hypothetical protein